MDAAAPHPHRCRHPHSTASWIRRELGRPRSFAGAERAFDHRASMPSGMVALPGLIDTHCHADQSLLRGLGDQHHWIPFLDDIIEPWLTRRDPADGVLANHAGDGGDVALRHYLLRQSRIVDPRDDYEALAAMRRARLASARFWDASASLVGNRSAEAHHRVTEACTLMAPLARAAPVAECRCGSGSTCRAGRAIGTILISTRRWPMPRATSTPASSTTSARSSRTPSTSRTATGSDPRNGHATTTRWATTCCSSTAAG